MEQVCSEFQKQFLNCTTTVDSKTDKIIDEVCKLKDDNYMIYQAVTGLNGRLEKAEINLFKYECETEEFKQQLTDKQKEIQNLHESSIKKKRDALTEKSAQKRSTEKKNCDPGVEVGGKEGQMVDAIEDLKETQDDLNDILLDLTNRFVKLENFVHTSNKEMRKSLKKRESEILLNATNSNATNSNGSGTEKANTANTAENSDTLGLDKKSKLTEITIEFEEQTNKIKKQLREVSNELFDNRKKMESYVKIPDFDLYFESSLESVLGKDDFLGRQKAMGQDLKSWHRDSNTQQCE
jgi:hypothetical protein